MEESNPNRRLEIKEEGLDIKTRWIKTAEISWHKEVTAQERILTVPVKCEELVVEKRYFMPESNGELIKTETERIPLREEKVEINLIPIQLQKVTISKQPIQGCRKIETRLKKEVLIVRNTGRGPEIEVIDID